MRLWIKLFLLVILAGLQLQAQSQPAKDSLYIVTYTTGSAWDVAKKPNEQNYFKEHSSNLSAWRKNGIIKLGARYAEKGMIIIAAGSIQAARELIFTDPAVVNKLFNADVQKLNLFYEGCLEK
jgi:hypothetical protein